MAVRSDNRLWVRKIDGDMHIVAKQPVQRLYPTSLDQVFESVERAKNPPLGGKREARAIGSHWGISHTGVTNGFMIETATPVHELDGNQTAGRLNKPLYDVIPHCLTSQALEFFEYQNVPPFNPAVMPTHSEIYLAHVESGMRIHELYAHLDAGDMGKGSLADLMKEKGAKGDYSGPWALETMGGAGGQTIAGAFSTGTHGGDILFGPIADAVIAVHLIDAKGEQHWIERTRLRPSTMPLTLIDKEKLEAHFPNPKIHYHSDDNLMNAVTVACGRMGVIYSVVLRVVRQFALEQHWKVQDWNDVKQWINGAPIFVLNRYLAIDVCPYGSFFHPSRHDCYVITRLLRPLDAAGAGNPYGRAERAGKNAGNGPTLGRSGLVFDNPCASDNFVRDALNAVKSELNALLENALKAGALAAAAFLNPFTPLAAKEKAAAVVVASALTIVSTTALIASIDLIIIFVIPEKMRFGDTMAKVTNYLADHDLFPIVRCLMEKAYKTEHEDLPKTAISYGIMDTHDYLNKGCNFPGDSIELFFDATSPNLIKFIDLVLYRVNQLQEGKLENGSPQVFGGYISLRFMAQTEAHIAMQRWPRTCSIEIAGLSRVNGTAPFLNQIEKDAINWGAVIHWGQRNNWSWKDVEKVYDPSGPSGATFKWRDALSQVTEHGRYDVFSTDFSKQMALEITTPIIETFSAIPTEACAGDQVTIKWEAIKNPPETEAILINTPSEGQPVRIRLGSLSSSRPITLLPGRATLTLSLERELNGMVYYDQREIAVRGFSDNDEWTFNFTAEPRIVDGVTRWAAESNLYSSYISTHLCVSQIRSTFPGITSWNVRNPDIADLKFTTGQNQHSLPSLPILNKNWLFFSDAPASAGPNPVLQVVFKIVCQH